MSQFENPQLQDLIEQLEPQIDQLVEKFHSGVDIDQLTFLTTFRDQLVKYGVDRKRASRLTMNFDLHLPDGTLSQSDIDKVAKTYAIWTYKIYIAATSSDNIDQDLAELALDSINLSLRFD